MSSGGYALLPVGALLVAPFAGAAIVAGATVAVAAGVVSGAARAVSEVRAINAEADRQKENVYNFYNETLTEIERCRQTLLQAQATNPDFQYLSESRSHSNLISIAGSDVITGFNDEQLFFTEVNADTGELTLVVIDFSDCMSIQNAKLSTEFRKMQASSDMLKRVLNISASTKKTAADINAFINEMNKMLDDSMVDYKYFTEHLYELLEILERRSEAERPAISPDMWNLYCAACAIAGERPTSLEGKNIEDELNRLTNKAVEAKYMTSAKQALIDSLRELGLEVEDEIELESIQGKILGSSEEPDFKMFFSEEGDGFMLEMVETGKVSENHSQQHRSVCKKRKMLQKLMAEKGYPIGATVENDEGMIKAQKVEYKKKQRDTAAERIRKKRALMGRQGKAMAIGG